VDLGFAGPKNQSIVAYIQVDCARVLMILEMQPECMGLSMRLEEINTDLLHSKICEVDCHLSWPTTATCIVSTKSRRLFLVPPAATKLSKEASMVRNSRDGVSVEPLMDKTVGGLVISGPEISHSWE
jgi:hypothetical protein